VSTDWVASAGLPQVAVYRRTLDPANQTLDGGTDGRSIWKLHAG